MSGLQKMSYCNYSHCNNFDQFLERRLYIRETVLKVVSEFHSLEAFHKEPQVLELSNTAKPVVQSNCIRCHSEQLAMVRLAGSSERTCWDCHSKTFRLQ